MCRDKIQAILAATFLYRVATSMGPLVILTARASSNSLALASFALTVWTLLGALSQPVWIAAARSVSPRLLVLSLGAVSALAHTGIGLAGSTPQLVAASAIAGATLPPVTAMARARLATMLTGHQRDRAFDFESSLASASFVIAPLVITGSSLLSASGPPIAAALSLATCCVLYTSIAGQRMVTPEEEGKPSRKSRLPAPIMVLTLAGVLCYASLACIEVAVVARFSDATRSAAVLSIWSLVSLASGFAVGAFAGVEKLRESLILLPVPAFLVMAGWADVSGVFIFSLSVSGLAVAPTLALIASEIARVAARPLQEPAYAWLQAGSWVGSASATAIAGLLAKRGLGYLLTFAAVLALACALIMITSARRQRVNHVV